jgi:hypothetical protein
MSTVVSWFGRLSFDQQRDALGRIQEQHDQAKSSKRAELEAQLAGLGYGVAKRRGRPRKSALANGNGQAPAKRRMAKVQGEIPGPKDEGDVVGPRPDGELAQVQAGWRREDREVSRLSRHESKSGAPRLSWPWRSCIWMDQIANGGRSSIPPIKSARKGGAHHSASFCHDIGGD